MSIESIINVFLVCSIFWFVFAITGVQIFAGRFGRCLVSVSDPTLANVSNKEECDNSSYYWRTREINFDNLGNALLALFHVATLDGWKRAMEGAVDARGVCYFITSDADIINSLKHYLPGRARLYILLSHY